MAVTTKVKIRKSTANEAGRQLAVGEGSLYGVIGYNANVAAQFILFFDSATTPANGAVPDFMVLAQAASPFVLGFGELGYPFTDGMYVCNSSTQATKTIGTTDCWFNAQLTNKVT